MSLKNKIHPKISALARKVTGKRAKAVINFIIKKGMVTTEDLEKMGYIHPPRAVRDVRENGIPIETIRVKGSNGKSIAAYKFGDYNKIQEFKLGGRSVFSKEFKQKLREKQNGRCAICNERYDEKFLQIDHRIPYEFMLKTDDPHTVENFMLLCAACNRIKARATETGCKETCFKSGDLNIIKSCFWASPEKYDHVCMVKLGRVDLVWKGEDMTQLQRLREIAENKKIPVSDLIKELVNKSLSN
jgi:hypothetical protein